MSFAWPHVLWFLAAPIALLVRDFTRRPRGAASGHPKIVRAEVGARALRLSRTGRDFARGRAAWGWLAGGLALAVVALARPQWGAVDEPVFGQSREILIAMDLSRSMLTQDVEPSRLERAKLLTQSLLDQLKGERVGLEIFAGTAFLQSPLSSDYDILREFLPPLGPDTMPVGGTNYGAMIDTAAGAFSSASGPGIAADRYLILLSDGGATDDSWRDHWDKLKALGVHVIALGVGTGTGGLIPDGVGGFLKDDRGAVVKATLEDSSLRELAERTGGIYRNASEWVDLPALLKSTVETGRRAKFVEKSQVRRIERFQWVLAPALLCLLISFWREFPVRPKAREVKLAESSRIRENSGEPPNSYEFGYSSRIRLHPEIPVSLLVLALLLPLSIRAADALPADASLARIVGRLANQDAWSPRDWAEMARETVDWGQHLQSESQTVPIGPIGDALAAVDAGSRLDPALTDWQRLRAELDALRIKPKEKKSPPPPPPQPKPQSQQKQNGGQSQQVGGAAERQRTETPTRDSSLVVPLEKLDQVRDQDEPGELLRMMRNNEPHPATKGKDW